MTKVELLAENEELRATLQAIYDQIAEALGIEDGDDAEDLEDDGMRA